MSRVGGCYEAARESYREFDVDTEGALQALAGIPVSLQCWQGDDVTGFEGRGGINDGGLAVTGNYPGRARTADELRADLDLAYSLIPGPHRLNLHAIYAETGGKPVDRNELGPEHFETWIDWAKARSLGLDFNPTFFAHEKAADGFTLSHRDPAIRRFWIEHGIACRTIGCAMGRALGTPAVTNIWIPDGMKDLPADRRSPRERLRESLDEIISREADPAHLVDSVESKLFGIGSEAYVVGSHEFYLSFAIERGIALCLDTGHFHPTEEVADKISAILPSVPALLLHVSRGVRWDSDHVVLLSDDVTALAREVIGGGYLDRVHFALDFFDASIHRVAAWVIGTRNLKKALLLALLTPTDRLKTLEAQGDFTGRLALMEELKTLPFGAVWDRFCEVSGVPVGMSWLTEVRIYETAVLATRKA
jgi:L-rhamnose isomerase